MVRSTLTILLLLAGLTTAACSYPSYAYTRGNPPAGRTATVEAIRLPPPTDAELVNQPYLTVVRLAGDGYQRGYLYGRAYSAEWKRATDEVENYAIDYVRDYVPPRFLAQFAVRQYSAIVARNFDASGSETTMPKGYRAYVQGIADGAGIDASRLQRNIALVMLSDASCSAFVAFGPATDDGRLLQMRNLDWGSTGIPAAEGTIVLLHEPTGGQRYLSIGFVGLVGSISGINESGLAISEIGSESDDKTQSGMPMPILLEHVLAEARTLDEAVALLRAAPGTGGYNYMIGSARERRGVVVEKTASHTAVFEIGPENYTDNSFFTSFAGFDCRADTSADPTVRKVQICSRGPGSPVESGAYLRRYLTQIEKFEQWGQQLTIERAAELALAVAPASNLHSILYDFERGRVYLRNQAWFKDRRPAPSEEERLRARAAAQPPAVIELRNYFPDAFPQQPQARPGMPLPPLPPSGPPGSVQTPLPPPPPASVSPATPGELPPPRIIRR